MRIELKDGPLAGNTQELPDYISSSQSVIFHTETKRAEYQSTGARNKDTGAMIYSAVSITDRVATVPPKQRKRAAAKKPPAAEFSA
jgi:hypothetical protein